MEEQESILQEDKILKDKIKVLHLLASNIFSGAENVACQIISCFDDFDEMYCSPVGKIEDQLKKKCIKYFPIKKLNCKEVRRVVAEFKPDIIHSHDARASIVASFSCKNIPIVSHIHCNDIKMSRIGLKSILFKLACKKIGHIFFVSKGGLETYRFKKSIVKKSSVLHNVINCGLVAKKAQSDPQEYKTDVVYVGRLSAIKNPLRLIDIMEKVVKVDKNIVLSIVGGGELENELRAYIANKKLNNNVRLLGFMSNPYKVISCSKLMLMTSISEGLPMCVLEAMSLGVPIISTKTDGVSEIIKNDERGFLYDTNDEAVRKIIEYLKDDLKLGEMKKNVIEFSKEYNDLAEYKESILKVYCNLKKNNI